MEIDLQLLEETLQTTEVVHLSTSWQDRVTARPVSPLYLDGALLVRTSGGSRKAEQMLHNPNVAFCAGAFYGTGLARSLGSVADERNAAIRRAYQARYPGSFSEEDSFIQSDELFFSIAIRQVCQWLYEDGEPVGMAESVLFDQNDR